MIIFPYINCSNSEGVIAYSATCITYVGYTRPIAGFICFHKDSLNFSIPIGRVTIYLSIAMHEITHTLVFSSSLFETYIDENDKPLTTPVTKKATINGTTRTLIITPEVLQAARIYF